MELLVLLLSAAVLVLFLQLGALKGLVGATQIVFGADYPYSTIVNHVDLLKNALEKRAMTVDVMPKEYVAESVVRSLRAKVIAC